MQSEALISRANRMNNNNFALSSRKFWKYDWFTPSRPIQTQTSEKTTVDNTEDDKYSFEYKVWQPSEEQQWKDLDENTDEALDLSLYDRTINVGDVEEEGTTTNGQTDDNALKMDDIRGAVGADETIPGLTATGTTNGNEKETDEVKESAVPETSTDSVDQVPDNEKSIPDVDGDIKLD